MNVGDAEGIRTLIVRIDNPLHCLSATAPIGSWGRTRTHDPLLNREPHYLLCYPGILVEMIGIEPTRFRLQAGCSPC